LHAEAQLPLHLTPSPFSYLKQVVGAQSDVANMCVLNFRPYDEKEIDHPLPHGQPKLIWAIPVDMSEVGTSLEAYLETLPQATALRLCHRFRDCSLSNLPQRTA